MSTGLAGTWTASSANAPLEPVEIQLTRQHAYVKSKRGCAECGQRKYAPAHIGQPPSVNALGDGNRFEYRAMKVGLEEALGLALEASSLPRGLGSVLVEGLVCFPDRRKRDQGNYRVLVEKALGDALQRLGYLPDDDWDRYEFGNLQKTMRPGESWTRLVIFPSAHSAASAA